MHSCIRAFTQLLSDPRLLASLPSTFNSSSSSSVSSSPSSPLALVQLNQQHASLIQLARAHLHAQIASILALCGNKLIGWGAPLMMTLLANALQDDNSSSSSSNMYSQQNLKNKGTRTLSIMNSCCMCMLACFIVNRSWDMRISFLVLEVIRCGCDNTAFYLFSFTFYSADSAVSSSRWGFSESESEWSDAESSSSSQLRYHAKKNTWKL
jgi:hypothetical protein